MGRIVSAKSAKEKAIELMIKYSGLVYPYIGSSMLTNDADDNVIFMNAKLCVEILLDEIIPLERNYEVTFDQDGDPHFNEEYLFWQKVKDELNSLVLEDVIKD